MACPSSSWTGGQSLTLQAGGALRGVCLEGSSDLAAALVDVHGGFDDELEIADCGRRRRNAVMAKSTSTQSPM